MNTTSTGDGGFYTNISGVQKATGSFKYCVDATTTNLQSLGPTQQATLTLALGNSGKNLSFNARLIKSGVENPAEGVVTAEVAFVSNGTITFPS